MHKKIISLIVVVILCVVLSSMATGCQVKDVPHLFKFNDKDYETVFFDDFDGDKLDTSKWKINCMIDKENPKTNGYRRGGFYVEDAISVKESNLVISTNYRKDGKYGEGWYTGWVETATNKDFATEDYKGFSLNKGYVECRCIAPPVNGIWSAFWMMPDEGVAFTNNDVQNTASDGCEIDIMESPHYFEGKSLNQHVVHADGYDSRHKIDTSPFFDVKTMYSEYHTYAVEWTDKKLIYYIDGYKTYETKVKYENIKLGVPDVLEYLILSVEIGGFYDKETGEVTVGYERDGTPSWAGDPMNNDLDKKYDFVVDYVKVMQHK